MSVHQKILKNRAQNVKQEEIVNDEQQPQEIQLTRPQSGTTQQLRSNGNNNEFNFVEKQLDEANQFNSMSNIRLTTTIFPKSRAVFQDSFIPLAAIIQPYGQSVQDGFPQTSYGSNAIVRCEQCKAYINPFMTFPRLGQDLKCNMCGWQGPLPSYYACEIDRLTGIRLDQTERPELHLGSFDIKAGQEYQARPPMPPTYFFMIDSSRATLDQGIIQLFSDTLRTVINENQLQGQHRTMFGIITYDSSIQLYNLKPSLKSPQIYCLTDLSEINLPIPDELLVNLEESRDLILNLLELFQRLFKDSKIQQATCFSKALDVAKAIMGHIGGKLIILSGSSSILQDPALQPKLQQGVRSYALPSSPTLGIMADEMHSKFICPSIFIFSKTYTNTITLAELTKHLNGDIHFYHTQDETVQKRFYYDFTQILVKNYTWESVFRLRVSRGFRINQTYGNFSIKSNDLLNVTCMDDQKSLMIEFDFEGGFSNHEQLYLQSALLYTSATGERRIRVHNYAIPLSIDAALIQNHADSTVIATYMTKRTLNQLYKTAQLNDLRTQLILQTKNIIKSSIKLSRVVPPSLQSLPMNVLGLLKHPILTTKYCSNVSTDITNTMRAQLNFYNSDEILINLVPYLFRIDDLTPENCYYTDDGQFVYPELISLNLDSIQQGGIFLMDLGEQLIIYLSKDHDVQLAQDIWGVHYQTLHLVEDMLYFNSSNSINTCLYYLITALRRRKFTGYASLYIAQAGDASTNEKLYHQSIINIQILEVLNFG